MKKLTKNDMKKLAGGLLPPINGVCYQEGENCLGTYHCCLNEALVCDGIYRKTCVRSEA